MTEPGRDGLRPSAESVLRIAELRWILVARASNAVGSSALLTVLGYQVYELGAFESGLAARFLGAVPAVLLGGVVTLFVTGLVAVFAPALRRLDLGEATLEAEELATLEEWAAPG